MGRGKSTLFWTAVLAWHGYASAYGLTLSCSARLAWLFGAPAETEVSAPAAIVPQSDIPLMALRAFQTTPVGAHVRVHLVSGEAIEGVTTRVSLDGLALHTASGVVAIAWREHGGVTILERRAERVEEAFPGVLASLDDARAAYERLQHYVAFRALSEAHWQRQRPLLEAELSMLQTAGFRARRERENELVERVNQALARLIGNRPYGLHYNRSGGQGFQYVDAGGIRATAGDSFLSGLAAMDRSIIGNASSVVPPTVFYYGSSAVSLGSFARSLHSFWSENETGVYLMVFDPVRIVREGRGEYYSNFSALALSFPRTGAEQIGVRYSDFLLPPLRVGSDVPARLGRRRMAAWERRIATLTHLESLLTDPEMVTFVPSLEVQTERVREPVSR